MNPADVEKAIILKLLYIKNVILESEDEGAPKELNELDKVGTNNEN